MAEVWPESFPGFKAGLVVEETRDVAPEQLLGGGCHALLTEHSIDPWEYEKALASLDPREKLVLDMRAKGKTLEEIGARLSVSRGRAGQIKDTAIHNLASKLRLIDVESQETKEWGKSHAAKFLEKGG